MTSPTIGVCGFGRCGTTMVMEMLAAGGIEPAGHTSERSHELVGGDDLDVLVPRLAASGALAGRTVKLLDYAGHWPVPTEPDWSFVWIDRNHVQQARSTLKLLGAAGAIERPHDDAPINDQIRFNLDLERQFRGLIASYRRDRPRILGELRRIGPVVVLQYEQVLANPRRAVRLLRRIAPALDGAAAGAVHRRDGTCRPHLRFEEAGVVA